MRRRRIIGPGFPYLVTPIAAAAPSSYVGPGDVQGGAWAWGGLQAYTAAYAASLGNCMDLVNGSLTPYSLNPIKFLSTGKLDTAAISTAITAGYFYVHQLYDHTINARHFIPPGNHPTITLDGPGGQPAIDCTPTSGMLQTTATLTTVAPFTVVAIVQPRAGISVGCFWGPDNSTTVYLQYRETGTVFELTDGGSTLTQTGSVGAYHSVGGLFQQGASSVIAVDGTSSTPGNAGSAALTGAKIGWGGNVGVGVFGTGRMLELGIFTTDVSANFGALDTNARLAGRWSF